MTCSATQGCWQVTGTARPEALTFVVRVMRGRRSTGPAWALVGARPPALALCAVAVGDTVATLLERRDRGSWERSSSAVFR
jgi:hypothetical protein